jgi:F-type H+-transporting ATPase subunit delta
MAMSNSSSGIAQKYSKAILNTISNASELEEIISEIQVIQSTLSSFTGLWHYLSSQWVPAEEKIATFNKLSDILTLSELTNAIIGLILSNHRLDLINDIITQLETTLCSMTNYIKIEIKSAVTLNKTTENIIRKSLQNVFKLGIKAEFLVDKSLIGGFIAYGDSVMLDLSFKGRINQLKREFQIQ